MVSGRVIASASAKVLGQIGDDRALPSLRVALERLLTSSEDLGTSTFYLALLEMDPEGSMDLIQRVRPSEAYVRHLLQATYPSIDIRRVKCPDYSAKAPFPVNYTVGYFKGGRVNELAIRFVRTPERVWAPEVPLPDELP